MQVTEETLKLEKHPQPQLRVKHTGIPSLYEWMKSEDRKHSEMLQSIISREIHTYTHTHTPLFRERTPSVTSAPTHRYPPNKSITKKTIHLLHLHIPLKNTSVPTNHSMWSSSVVLMALYCIMLHVSNSAGKSFIDDLVVVCFACHFVTPFSITASCQFQT